MLLSDRNRVFSQRAVLVGAVFVVLAALICVTGCDSSSHPSQATREVSVADTNNNRVLIYTTPLSVGQSAMLVLGQADFVSGGAALSASRMSAPDDTADDSLGNLYVTDHFNHRVLQFKPPFSNGMAASLVIGQPDFVTGASNATQNGLDGPEGLVIDGSGNLWVVDTGNSRILRYTPSFSSGMNASLVIGQASFTAGGAATTNSRLWNPEFVAFDDSGNLWVADSGNNRVLEFEPPFANGMTASLVIGQTDFVSAVAATTVNGLRVPAGIAFDSSGNLWVGDSGNSRVLQFKPPFANGMSASLVLGQADFVTLTAHTTQNGFAQPRGISFDSKGNLQVADSVNNRSLIFEPPFSTNQNASTVLGQPDFTTSTATSTATGERFPFSIRPL